MAGDVREPNDDPTTFRIEERVLYNADKGEVQTYIEGRLREVIAVRAALMNQAIAKAAAIELRRLGYTVLSPEAKKP